MTLMTHEQRVEAKAREIQEALGIVNRAPKVQRRRRVAVQCVEKGWVFPSLTAAASAMRLSTAAISLATSQGWRAGGYHWKLVGKQRKGMPDEQGLFF